MAIRRSASIVQSKGSGGVHSVGPTYASLLPSITIEPFSITSFWWFIVTSRALRIKVFMAQPHQLRIEAEPTEQEMLRTSVETRSRVLGNSFYHLWLIRTRSRENCRRKTAHTQSPSCGPNFQGH